jgi:hypothetical protein
MEISTVLNFLSNFKIAIYKNQQSAIDYFLKNIENFCKEDKSVIKEELFILIQDHFDDNRAIGIYDVKIEESTDLVYRRIKNYFTNEDYKENFNLKFNYKKGIKIVEIVKVFSEQKANGLLQNKNEDIAQLIAHNFRINNEEISYKTIKSYLDNPYKLIKTNKI